MTATEPVADTRLEEFRQLLDEASDAYEHGEGGRIDRFRSALAVFRGRWGVVLRGILAWSAQTTSVRAMQAEDVERSVEQAVREESVAPAAPPEERAAPAEVAVEDEERQRERDEALVNVVRERRTRKERELEAEAKRLRFFELIVVSLLVVAAVIALTVATIGAVMILSNPAAGAVVAAVALVPGGGVAILFKAWRTLAAQRTANAAAHERNADALESLQARLSVSDQGERDRLIGEYAADLRRK
jgi:hypothetical protein